jgi:hypothetical protein
MSETIVKSDHAATTYRPTADTTEAGYLRRVWRAVRNTVNEMNYGSERMAKRQAPWW